MCVDVDVFSVYFMQPNEKETFDVHELNVSAIFMYLPLAFAAEYVNVILSLVFHLVCSCAILSVPLQPPVYQMKKKTTATTTFNTKESRVNKRYNFDVKADQY